MEAGVAEDREEMSSVQQSTGRHNLHFTIAPLDAAELQDQKYRNIP